MTKQEIEQASKEHSQDVITYQVGYIAGATFVNERQPYTAEDMKPLLSILQEISAWLSFNLHPSMYELSKLKQDIDELLKLWEEKKWIK
jgi:hypothetical protein